MKHLRFILGGLCAAMLAPTLQAAPLTSYFPTTGVGEFLAENFDLASIRSSFGPRRLPGLRTFADFRMVPTKATDHILEFERPDWMYRLVVVERGDINRDGIEDLAVCFTDKALGGPTYYSQDGLLITRYSANTYAVALSYSVDACAGSPPASRPEAAHTRNAPDFERVGRFIYAFHRAGVSVDALKGTDIATGAPPELSGRARRLAEKFDLIVQRRAQVPDAEVKATLAEAGAVGAAIRTWRNRREN